MKRFNFILLIMFIAGLSFAQTKVVMERVSETGLMEGSYVIDARPLLEKFEKANHIDLRTLPQAKPSLKKVAWNFSVGSTHIWWAQNTVDKSFYSVPSTCRAVGVNCYVFVEDSSWIKNVNQSAVDQIVNAFDNSTPANSSKGVYRMDVDTFGNPPNVDGDSKIIILILNILDGYNGTGGYTAGYFWAGNEYPTSSVTNSNVAEVYYMDCNPLNLTNQNGISLALQITAHEFQHMIQWNYHGNVNGPNHTANANDTFFNEGCSMIAEVVCGYPLRLQSYYSATSQTNVYMTDWNKNPPGEVLSDYARAARFFLYIKEQFGVSALTKFVQSSLTNANAFDYSVFPALGSPRRFSDVVVDWWIANAINNKAVDPKWGYDYSGLGTVSTQIKVNPNLSNYSESVYKFGVRYYKFTSGSNLSINLNTQGNVSISMKAIKIGSTTTVTDLTTNASNSIPDFGTPYPNVILMIYHNDQNEFSSGPFSYTLNSTGTFQNTPQEIAYDQTEPNGYLALTPGDSVAVVFDGISGAKLDSIRVAVRGIATLNGGVYTYAGLASQLGGKKLATVTVAPTLTSPPPVVNQGSDYPYEAPYKNWVKVDLTSSNIDASNNFVVEFPIGDAYPTTNRVMITYYQSSSAHHSYFYQSSSGSWVYYSVSGKSGYIFLNLIRAYVSFLTDVKQVVELTPASFRLEQNYPNPFNPSTNISYQLPTSSHVTLKVYDMLGQEVATLVDEFQTAGTHNSQFSIMNSQLSSGVYFYTIKAGNYFETKKMILMK